VILVFESSRTVYESIEALFNRGVVSSFNGMNILNISAAESAEILDLEKQSHSGSGRHVPHGEAVARRQLQLREYLQRIIAPTEIARLAYSYWEARGCQGGSPEEDWLRAERELGGAVLNDAIDAHGFDAGVYFLKQRRPDKRDEIDRLADLCRSSPTDNWIDHLLWIEEELDKGPPTRGQGRKSAGTSDRIRRVRHGR